MTDALKPHAVDRRPVCAGGTPKPFVWDKENGCGDCYFDYTWVMGASSVVMNPEPHATYINSEHYWDWALATGRQCYGLFVPDHGLHKKDFGVNVMVVPERTAHPRNGARRLRRKAVFPGGNAGVRFSFAMMFRSFAPPDVPGRCG
ncbi:MAG: hypothetical protein PHG71_06440 [Kiritimatiellae bacterium]|nr:hypothetical protein [Kiritimatiellia bacterium]